MNCFLNRYQLGEEAVLGDLCAGDLHLYTLESRKDMIPTGIFPLRVTESGRAKSGSLWSPDPPYLPLIINVPGRSGIRIHAGNTVKDTVGCPLVGMTVDQGQGRLGGSRIALTRLMNIFDFASHTITVADFFPRTTPVSER